MTGLDVLGPGRRRRRAGRYALLALLAAPWSLPAQAAGPCPWVVQPHDQLASAAPAAGPAFDIQLDAPVGWAEAFYAFTVTDLEAAWQLVAAPGMPDLRAAGRPLEPVATDEGGLIYRLAPDSLQPETLYVVAAKAPVAELEVIAARIEPARPFTVSALTRGGSDLSGPLPPRRLPGVELKSAANDAPRRASADTPVALASPLVCAYQVAVR